MKILIKRYRFFLVMVLVLVGIGIFDHPREIKALRVFAFSQKKMYEAAEGF